MSVWLSDETDRPPPGSAAALATPPGPAPDASTADWTRSLQAPARAPEPARSADRLASAREGRHGVAKTRYGICALLSPRLADGSQGGTGGTAPCLPL